MLIPDVLLLKEPHVFPIMGSAVAIEAAGLRMERSEDNPQYQFMSNSARGATEKWGVKSVSILARRV
jgi:hypothetical protein